MLNERVLSELLACWPCVTSASLSIQVNIFLPLWPWCPAISHPLYSGVHPDGHSYVPGTMICEERVET